ncbi:MAG: hypothetical protein QFF03_13845, partial [Pseudomonadota bacterium]|nr:hypothetical protein [Pseudomonadota bacterium]
GDAGGRHRRGMALLPRAPPCGGITMRRRLIATALTLACAHCAYAPATAAPINCPAAGDDVERTICAHPELLARDLAMSDRLYQVNQRCPAAHALLAQGQKFWLRERWDCRSMAGAFETPDVLPNCLASRMDQRLQRLDDIGGGCDLTALAASYRFVDVGYLLRFGDRYLGRKVSVFGWMDLASCHAPRATPTAATVVGTDRKRARLRVKFSAMPAEQHDFLCATHPAAHWTGTIERDHQGNYLFLTDILGGALPAP